MPWFRRSSSSTSSGKAGHPPLGVGGQHRKPWGVIALVSLWLAGPANWSLWRALGALPELGGAHGAVFMTALGLMIAAAAAVLLSAVAWRSTLKPVIGLLLVTAAVGAHFMGTYGIVIDPTMIVNIMGTDAHETRDLLSLRLVFTVGLLAVLPMWWVLRTPLDHGRWRVSILNNAGGVMLGLITVVATALHHAWRYRRIPAPALT